MKKIITIIFLCMLVVACKKKATAPATPAPQQQAPAPTLTNQEQQLVGLWLMDSMASYLNNIRANVTIYTNTTTCRMEFLSTDVPGGGYNLQDGHSSCTLSQQIWKAPVNGQFNIGAFIHPITLITSTKLHFIWNGGGGVEYKYYLHK